MTLFEETILKMLRKGAVLDPVDFQERLAMHANTQLSRPQLLERLVLMENQDLIEATDIGYRITPKGRELLQQ